MGLKAYHTVDHCFKHSELKSDQNGIERLITNTSNSNCPLGLKSDQNGIESLETCMNKELAEFLLKSDQIGIESVLSQYTYISFPFC